MYFRSCLNANGLRLRDLDQLPHIGIVKRMAADVSSEKWNERLVVDFGNRQETAQCSDASAPEISSENIVAADLPRSLPSQALPSNRPAHKKGRLF